ncbi:MAG: DUF4405 domain-containing protein [Campylobacterota bacterium]|nr:DUF4405 domain-containing protein [Campylobacterota bacterium]
MKLKKITSLLMLWSLLMMVYTGIVLYIAPHGRVAYWTDWELFGWSKDQFAQIHTTFMVLFVIATILHIYYNWKPLTGYMKNRLKQFIFFTKEMLVALLISLLFLLGTLYSIPPFSNFLQLGDSLKDGWAEKSQEPPYGHAEESTLKDFSQKTGYDLPKVIEVLKEHNLSVSENQTIKEIAAHQSMTAIEIYTLITATLGAKEKRSQISGLGRKEFGQIAKELNIDIDQFLQQLDAMGIKAKKEDKFRSTVEKQGFNAREVITSFLEKEKKEK